MSPGESLTIVGAGPYGLSIAAFLRARGIGFRIIGSPMRSWRRQMPKGMQLKSAGLSSTLYDPERRFTLEQYCAEQGIPYEDAGLPVRIETFIAYGEAFQARFVPEVEDVELAMLKREGDGFDLRLTDGSAFRSRRVLVAVGLDYFRRVPGQLESLPRGLWSHAAEHSDLEVFRGRDVLVLGAGASAVDTAVLLQDAGARPVLAARRPTLDFNVEEAAHRPLLQRLLAPMTGVGPGWRNRIYTDVMPWIFRALPDRTRLRITRESFGPAAGWFMKSRAAGVPQLLGHDLTAAAESAGRALLTFRTADGGVRQVAVDHVIAATGYRADVERLPFLEPDLRRAIRLIDRAPRLSGHFESSVPGLYFVGPISATSFGPIMRFSLGAGFTARRIAPHLAAAIGGAAGRAPQRKHAAHAYGTE